MWRWCQSTVRTTLDGPGSLSTSVLIIRRKFSFAFIQTDGSTSPARQTTRSVEKLMLIPTCIANWVGRRYIISTNNMPASVSGSPRSSTSETSPFTAPRSTIISQPHPRGNTDNTDPFIILSKFLSPHICPQPGKLPANTLRLLYMSLRQSCQLRRLTSKQLTQLLSLMGSLSLPTPRAPCIYISTLISCVAESPFQTHWPFVLSIARDKERLGHALNGTDRYWIMRAQLAKVVVTEGEDLRSGDSRLHALSQARVQYLRIWRHSPDPEIHLPYFDALLSLHSSTHVSELVRRLCKVLELHSNPHSRFLDVLYQILIKHGHVLESEHKARLLDMASIRLSRFSHDISSQKNTLPLTVDEPKEVLKTCKSGTVEIHKLMGAVIFPSYSLVVGPLPQSLRQWAVTQARNAFAPAVSLETRWINLLLLAISRMPQMLAQGVLPLVSTYSDIGMVNWRTVFVLAILKQTLDDMSLSTGSSFQQEILNITRPLWRIWKAAGTNDIDQSVTVTRLIVAGFFRVSSLTMDAPLKDACYKFCAAKHLFVIHDADDDAEKLQSRDLMVAYILAEASCQGTRWPNIFSRLTRVSPGLHWRHDVLVALIQYYTPRDVEVALGLYLFGKDNGIHFSPAIVHAVGISLANPRTWEIATPFLHYSQFSRTQVEELLGSILRVFQVERRKYIDSPVVENLGQVMWKLYSEQPPLQRYKYPVRFFFSIMIATGHAAKAIDIIEAIHRQRPLFFTTRLFLRLMRTLARFRQLHLISRLLRLVPPVPTRASDDLRRKVTLYLAETGASVRARKVYRAGIPCKSWRTTKESLARAVHFRTLSPSVYHTLRVLPILKKNPSNGPSIKYAVNILVRARRLYAAIKLLGRMHHLLDLATKASICNTIIHGRLLRSDVRNGRRVRSVLRTKALLETKFAFVSDRTTVNIILKAILQWRRMMDPPRLKRLFDHMIRIGYPASSRWCRQCGVPFGTPLLSPSENFNLLKLPSPISFERHVRPMYKMFIKGFYVRHDISAAKTVVGILKEEEVAAVRRKEERNRARRKGLVEKLRKGKRKSCEFV